MLDSKQRLFSDSYGKFDPAFSSISHNFTAKSPSWKMSVLKVEVLLNHMKMWRSLSFTSEVIWYLNSTLWDQIEMWSSITFIHHILWRDILRWWMYLLETKLFSSRTECHLRGQLGSIFYFKQGTEERRSLVFKHSKGGCMRSSCPWDNKMPWGSIWTTSESLCTSAKYKVLL